MRKILKVLVIYCISFIFFSVTEVIACEYKSSDNKTKVSLKLASGSITGDRILVSIIIDNRTIRLGNGSVSVESSLIDKLKNGECPIIYLSCLNSNTCNIYTQSRSGAETLETIDDIENEDLYCTYISDEGAKFLISKENGYSRVFNVDNFVDINNLNSSIYNDFNNFSAIINNNECDDELYYIYNNNSAVIYKNYDNGRIKASLTQNDMFLDCSYRSMDINHYYLEDDKKVESAFTIKYNLIKKSIQDNIVGFGFFENKTITKSSTNLQNNSCETVLYYGCSDDYCSIYSNEVSNKSVAVLNDLIKVCDYGLSDDNSTGVFQIYYYDKYAIALPTGSWGNGTKIISLDTGGALSSCPDNMYYRCDGLRYGQNCSITTDNSDYQIDDITTATKKADLIGQRNAPGTGVGTTITPSDASTTNGEVTICNYTMNGKFDDKSGFRIRYVKDIDEIEVWPTGEKAEDALFTGGGYTIINQLNPTELKSGNCLQEFYYKIEETIGNKYKFTLSDNSENGWNLATLDE